MFLGGGIHTTTPNDSYTMKRKGHKCPLTPIDFNLNNYIDIEEATVTENELSEDDDTIVVVNQITMLPKTRKLRKIKPVKIMNRL